MCVDMSKFHSAARSERARGVRGREFDPRHSQTFLLFGFTVVRQPKAAAGYLVCSKKMDIPVSEKLDGNKILGILILT